MIDKKILLWGGAGVVALAGAWFVFHKGSSGDSGAGAAYMPSTVYGLGSVAGADPGGLGGTSGLSTDNSIAQVIAANLGLAQLQSNAAIHTSDNQKDVALATLDANKLIALNDNQTTQNVALASRLGDVINAFTSKVTSTTGGTSGFFGIGATAGSSYAAENGPGSIVGSLGFDNGKLDINLSQGPAKAA